MRPSGGPALPPFIDQITLRDVRVGNLTVDIAVHREGTGMALRVPRKDVRVKVTVLFD